MPIAKVYCNLATGNLRPKSVNKTVKPRTFDVSSGMWLDRTELL